MNFINSLLAFLFSGFMFSQAQPSVDFYRAAIHIIPDSSDKSLNGEVTYWFNVLEKTDSVFLDAKNMKFSSVLVLSLIHISEPTRQVLVSRMPSSA